MGVFYAKVTTKGQVTLPKAVRESLAIRTGDRIEFSVEAPQRVTLKRMQAPGSSAGCGKAFLRSGQVALSHADERALMLNEAEAKYGTRA
jgi:AbrB family looped-hinge helix DNA binding protein